MKKEKRGVFFSIDVLIALGILLLAVLIIYPVVKSRHQESFIQQDVLDVLSSLKTGEINNAYVQELIEDEIITDLNKSLLDQIGEFYVTDKDREIAKNLANESLNYLNTKENIGIWYGESRLASKNTSSLETAKNIEVERRLISGIRKGSNVTGFSARAFLSREVQTKYFYFGGYVGEGNISAKIDYNGTLLGVEMELVVDAVGKDYFNISINNTVITGPVFEDSSSEFTPISHDISAYRSLFQSGDNEIKLFSDTGNLHIAGGFIKITYKNNETYRESKRYYFPGVEGLINIYDGFYIPNNLDEMEIYLHLDTNFTTFLTIGNTTIFRNYTNGEETITIDNAELLSKLNYLELINKTIPYRFGMENVSYSVNLSQRADIISVTDLSGSMNSQDKIINAIEANLALIDIILNFSGNRLGLVGYESSVRDSDFHRLSDDSASLKNLINTEWDASGGTCICCGINKATEEFRNSITNPNPITIRDELVGYYKLDGNALDSSGLENDGIIYGSPSFIPGVHEDALKPTGSGDYIGTYNEINSEEFSISLWFNPSSLIESEGLMEGYGMDQSSDTWFSLQKYNGNLSLNIDYWDMEEPDDSYTLYLTYNISSIPIDTWHQIVIVFKSGVSPAGQLYVDGNLVSINNSIINGNLTLSQLLIGGWSLNSSIDEVRFYDKSLNPTEIQGLYNKIPVCGNNIIEVGEACDGNNLSCIGEANLGFRECNPGCGEFGSCILPPKVIECGDDWVDDNEECDDGNLIDGDGCSSSCIIEPRYKSMIVMSDGNANGKCSEQGTGNAKQDAIQAACDAFNNYGIIVYAIGFGSGADETTLQAIADCGNGSYYFSDIAEIVNIYEEIAEKIIEASYSEQTIETNASFSTKLYPDSYIEFDYEEQEIPYGLVLTTENKFYDNYSGNFDIPEDSMVLEANVISYSGPRWTDNVELNGISVYNLSDYGSVYMELGDPYSINIPSSLVQDNNIVKVTTGLSSTNSTQGSEHNKIIYKILKDMVAYSSVSGDSKGCIWDIQFEDDTILSLRIPSSYTENVECSYTSLNHVLEERGVDAIQEAVFNLLKLLDFDDDGRVDIKFINQSLEIGESEISGIPYSYSTEVKVIVWD